MNSFSVKGSGSISYGKGSIAGGKGSIINTGNINNNIFVTDDSNNITSEKNENINLENKTLNSVFISYSHKDSEFANNLKSELETYDIKVIMDNSTMKIGTDINNFIESTIKETDLTISIISSHSLMSAWVLKEYLETSIHEHVQGSKKYIPIYIDKSLFDDDFFIESIKNIQIEIDKLNNYINEDSVKDIKIPNLTIKRDRLLTLKQNLGEFLYTLNNILVADFTNNDKYHENISNLIDSIKK